jgi:hypothetical protein
MSQVGGFSRQWSDLLAYVLFPCLCVLTPASFSRCLLRRISGWKRLLAVDVNLALEGALKHLEIIDETAWKQRWKQVELLDVRDLYMMLFGRSRSVMAEIDPPDNFEIARNRVMVGMHWGPAISILKLLANAGMQPTFPYRPPERELLRSRPFYYLFCSLATRYLSTTLKDRAVTTGGAGKVLQELLEVPGSICVLMDAPAQKGRPAMTRQVLGAPATFNVGFPGMFVERGKEYVLYAMNLADDGTVRKKLEFNGPFRAGDTGQYMDNYVKFLDQHLSGDSSQWRIWRAEHQVWTELARDGDHQ